MFYNYSCNLSTSKTKITPGKLLTSYREYLIWKVRSGIVLPRIEPEFAHQAPLMLTAWPPRSSSIFSKQSHKSVYCSPLMVISHPQAYAIVHDRPFSAFNHYPRSSNNIFSKILIILIYLAFGKVWKFKTYSRCLKFLD